MTATLKTQLGAQAEQKARRYLESRGLRFVVQNYRNPCGEIDLIMRDGEDIVFVEVRSRTGCEYGSAIESINNTKRKKIIKTATLYLQKNNYFDKVNCRFDVIGIVTENCEWIKNAFSTDNFY
jgi:putative endonuclease